MSMDLSGFVRHNTKIKIGTKEFTFTEVSLGDLAECRAEMNSQRQKYNAERRARILEDAGKIDGVDSMELLKFTDKPLTDDEFDEQLDSLENIGLLAFYSLRYHHEKVSKDDVLQIITPGVLERVTAAMFPKTSEEPAKKKRTRSPVKP